VFLVVTAAAAAVLLAVASRHAAARGDAGTAATAYLAPSGSDGAACTSDAPCRRLRRGLDAVGPGGVVVLAGGEYDGQELAGSGDGAVIRAADGADPVFGGRLLLDGVHDLTIRGITLSHDIPDAGIEIQCTSHVTLEDVVGKSLGILGGNQALTVRGGSFGGYNTPSVEEDSVIGALGTEPCASGSGGPVSRGVLLDGVEFHDSYWPVRSRDDFGSSHPDCFQFIGAVDGMVIRNSRFLRCGDSFIGLYPDQGPIRNVVIENNLFRDLGGFTYFGIQMADRGHPYPCGGLVFRRNMWWPDNPTSLTPYSGIRSDCAGGPTTLVSENLFQSGPDREYCREQRTTSSGARYSANVFLRGAPCGTAATLPWGLTTERGRIIAAGDKAKAVRALFAVAAAGRTPREIRSLLRGRGIAGVPRTWSSARIAALLTDARYRGGTYGPPGTTPRLVADTIWRKAQATAKRS
jgi:hypothetical protein